MVLTLNQKNVIWDNVLDEVKKQINDRHLFDSFIADTKIYKIEGNKMFISTGSKLSCQFLNSNDHYLEIIKNSLKKATETEYEITFISKDEIKENTKILSNEQKNTFFSSCSLNPKYTFDNFVVGPCNKEAVQASLLVASNPGVSFNPLFIYAKSGLGKTHLIHALGNYIRNLNPYKKVLYITTDAFIDEYIKFSRGEQQEDNLKDFLKNVDVLLVDDIQFLSEKVKTSEMFFNIFNTLVSNNKQIVLTSDRHPNELKGLEERLVSRFNMGLSVNIKNPDTSTLIEILKTKIESNGLDVKNFDEEGLSFLAENFSKNVRELEGALNRLLFYTINVKHVNKIDLNIIKESVKPMISSKDKSKLITEDRIIEVVGDYYHLTENQIKSKVRTSQIALARQICMYLCRSLVGTPYLKIGKIFGRDHSTVMTACEKVDLLLKTDSQLQSAINTLKKQLKS
ncbi:MAG: chromosomal replication initiator protein DnaA [Bacilli bacterium]|nr:chromosomal replication initiator protein DnaA [Bacillales bacterium]MDY2574882.1 chromosomal replication initiator protein DnaA [Bacilli bacterium]